MIRKCEWCGKEFDAKTTWQRFHDDNCKQAWHYHQRADAYKREQARGEQKPKPSPQTAQK